MYFKREVISTLIIVIFMKIMVILLLQAQYPEVQNPYYGNGFYDNINPATYLYRWEAGILEAIVYNGYKGVDENHIQALIAKSPLLPGIVRALSQVSGLPHAYVMFLVHCLTVWMALAESRRALEYLVPADRWESVPRWLVFSPLFITPVFIWYYDEPLALAFMWRAFYEMRRGNDWRAGISLGFLVLTRLLGILWAGLMLVHVLVETYQQWHGQLDVKTNASLWIRLKLKHITPYLIPLIVIGFWIGFTTLVTGIPLAPLSSQSLVWNRGVWRSPVWSLLDWMHQGMGTATLLPILQITLIGIALAALWTLICLRRGRLIKSPAIYALWITLLLLVMMIAPELYAFHVTEVWSVRFLSWYIRIWQYLLLFTGIGIFLWRMFRHEIPAWMVVHMLLAFAIPMASASYGVGRFLLASVMAFLPVFLPESMWKRLSVWEPLLFVLLAAFGMYIAYGAGTNLFQQGYLGYIP